MRIDDSGDSWSATTNFEQFRHHELLDMMTGHDAATVLHVGQTLTAASTHMQTLADDLATHINGLQWEGEAADNFKTWARQVIQATDTLSIYTSNTAVAINMAGETLSSTQLPPVPAQQATVDAYVKQFGAKYTIGADGAPRVTQPTSLDIANDPATQPLAASNLISHQEAYNAQVVAEAAHQDAIGQMEKLGGSYVGAKQTLGVSTVPEFPPAPASLMPTPGQGRDVVNTGTTRAGSGTSEGIYGGSVSTYKSTSGTKSSSSSSSSGKSSSSKSFVSPDSPSTGSGSTSGGTGTSGGTTTIQGVSGPSSNGSGSGSTSTSGGGGTSGGSGSGSGVVSPVLGGSSGGGVGGESGGAGSGGIAGTGQRGTTTGSEGGASGESGSGIHGGVPATGEAPVRSSSGNVIGAGAKGSGASSAFARGRGIGGSASRSGVSGEYANGTAGGLTASAGTMAESSGSSTARSGLEPAAARGEATGAEAQGSESGMMPMGGGGMGGAGRGRGRKRGRAAYLVEDEETWTQGDAEANPSVIQ